jgi:hypothetical protein
VAVPQNGHVKHRFVVENTGAGVLRIDEVDSSCGCTVASPAQNIVPPGGTTHIDVDLHATPYRWESSVYVHTNDPVESVIRLSIAASEVPRGSIGIEFIPSVVRLDATVGEQEPSPSSFKPGTNNWRVTSWTSWSSIRMQKGCTSKWMTRRQAMKSC